MRYVCQLGDGDMLVENDGLFAVEYTGYPYQDTEMLSKDAIAYILCAHEGSRLFESIQNNTKQYMNRLRMFCSCGNVSQIDIMNSVTKSGFILKGYYNGMVFLKYTGKIGGINEYASMCTFDMRGNFAYSWNEFGFVLYESDPIIVDFGVIMSEMDKSDCEDGYLPEYSMLTENGLSVCFPIHNYQDDIMMERVYLLSYLRKYFRGAEEYFENGTYRVYEKTEYREAYSKAFKACSAEGIKDAVANGSEDIDRFVLLYLYTVLGFDFRCGNNEHSEFLLKDCYYMHFRHNIIKWVVKDSRLDLWFIEGIHFDPCRSQLHNHILFNSGIVQFSEDCCVFDLRYLVGDREDLCRYAHFYYSRGMDGVPLSRGSKDAVALQESLSALCNKYMDWCTRNRMLKCKEFDAVAEKIRDSVCLNLVSPIGGMLASCMLSSGNVSFDHNGNSFVLHLSPLRCFEWLFDYGFDIEGLIHELESDWMMFAVYMLLSNIEILRGDSDKVYGAFKDWSIDYKVSGFEYTLITISALCREG